MRHTPSGARQVLKWTMTGKMAVAIGLPGLNDLGRSVTPIFDGSFSLPLSTRSEEMKKSTRLSTRSLKLFSKHTIEFLSALSALICAEGLSFVKKLPAIENYLRNRPTSTKYG